MPRRSLMKKTLSVSSANLLSRFFGFIRDMVLIRYLGVGAAADAFHTAFRIPNSLRKIFAEGALSAALIPTLVRVVKEQGREAASRLMTHVFVITQAVVLALCVYVSWHAQSVICLIAPGFSAEQAALAIPLLRILIFYILFVSSSAVLAGALQAINRFFVPSLGQVIFNILVIVAAVVCMFFSWSATTFAWFIVLGGLIQLGMHFYAYTRHQFSVLAPDAAARQQMGELVGKFLPCVLSVGMLEINTIIDAQFASYLPVGSITLLAAALSFFRIPLGILAVPFSSILLPHLARIGAYAPRRLGYYLLESAQLVFWFIIPTILIMSFFAYDIFATLYLSENFPLTSVVTAQWLLIIMLLGLFFFSLNKIVLNIFYALHETFIPTVITLVGAIINTILNYLLMGPWGVYGLAAATSLAGAVQFFLLVYVLHTKFKLPLYYKKLGNFIICACAQFALAAVLFAVLFIGGKYFVASAAEPWRSFFLYKIGFWLWVGPIAGGVGLMLLYTRRWFGLRLYFLDK